VKSKGIVIGVCVCMGGGVGGKKEHLLLESSHASPALPSHRNSMEMKV